MICKQIIVELNDGVLQKVTSPGIIRKIMLQAPNIQFTKNFSLASLTETQQPLNNTPGSMQIENLRVLAGELQKLYDKIGPFSIVSAFRSPAVNSAVGGATGSYHTSGIAADIAPFNYTPETFFKKIFETKLSRDLGEIILKPQQGTIHVSLPTASKQSQPMILDSGVYRSMSGDEINRYIGQAYALAKANPVKTSFAVLGLVGAMAFLIYKIRK